MRRINNRVYRLRGPGWSVLYGRYLDRLGYFLCFCLVPRAFLGKSSPTVFNWLRDQEESHRGQTQNSA
jgi:hypothetical protein